MAAALSLREPGADRPWWLKSGALVCGASGVLVCVWLWRFSRQAWAPWHAEIEIARTLARDGLRRVFKPSAEDGTAALTWKERVQRVSELRAILNLERFHQIDNARRSLFGQDGWGKTSGLHHMQHLPGLVFRGEDQAICRQALDRSAHLFENPREVLKLQQEWENTPIIKDLVLIGGGHSHANVLRMLAMEPMAGVRVTLVARDVETPYSGMLPGHVAGAYTRRECHLDLNVLARFARVRLVQAAAIGLDLQNKRVLLDGDRPPIGYDVLSINIGSAPQVQDGSAEAGVTPVKPISHFGARWDHLLEGVPTWRGERRLLVVGGGAGGFELAMSMHARLKKELAKSGNDAKFSVGLVTRSGLLPQHTPGARALAEKALREKGVELHIGYNVSHAENGLLHCKDGQTLPYDDCIWCTQGSPQGWIRECGLKTDNDGFLLVDQQLRCSALAPLASDGSHIFAGGDIASVDGFPRPKAGVFAVMAGMALWINIRATLMGDKMVTYWPQSSFLGLFSLGDGSCIASRGTLAMEGKWLWDLKDWIDRRWMWNYDKGLPDMPEATNVVGAGVAVAKAAGGGALDLLRHATMRCGGCGAKVGATTLSQAMARVDAPKQPGETAEAKVVVGIGDDAAVVELQAEGENAGALAAVQTIDFFRSFIGDPYMFGRIAAVHALSDCEAMGAIPQTVLALVQVPFAAEEKQEEDIVQLMSGAASALREAGCALVGGHTCEARELGLGFSVNGRLPGGADQALTKADLKPGHVLILTKPLGTGTLFAADMRAKARGPWIAEALKSMGMLNRRSSDILRAHGASACTDVTGFGLVGHLLEMCKASGVRVAIDLDAIPIYDGALECIEMGIASSLQPANTRLRRAVQNHDEVCGSPAYPLLYDPQTAGGLLAAVPKGDFADACVKALRATGAAPRATIIGEVIGLAPASGDGALELITVKVR